MIGFVDSSLISSIATIIGFFVPLFALVYQIRSFTANRVQITNDVAEWEVATIKETGEIIEEVIMVKCINEGFVSTAIEHARFEFQFLDQDNNWNIMDVVGVDMKTQLAMPIKLEPASTVKLIFVFNKQRSNMARKNRLMYIQKLIRDKKEMKREVSLSNKNFMFMNEKTAK